MSVCLWYHLHPLCMLQWNIYFWQLLDCGVEGWLVYFPPFQPHCCLLVVGPEGVASVDQLGGMYHCVLIPLCELVANNLSR